MFTDWNAWLQVAYAANR